MHGTRESRHITNTRTVLRAVTVLCCSVTEPAPPCHFFHSSKRLQKIQKMKYLCKTIVEKILDMAFTAAIGEIISYVTAWCWNQASVQEMRRKFEDLLVRAKMVNPTAQQSNTANFQVQQLLRELQNEAEQGKELLDGQPTPVNLSNAKERFERIRVVASKLNDLLLSNAREAGVHPKIKRPQFKPRYLNRRTRFQVIRRYNCS